MASFTHYWEGNTCDAMFADGLDGETLDHTAGKLFTQRGVGPGDKIYVVNNLRGNLVLIGRLEVDKIVSQAEAERLLGDNNLWDAPEHVIAKPGTSTPMRFERIVPMELTKSSCSKGQRGLSRPSLSPKTGWIGRRCAGFAGSQMGPPAYWIPCSGRRGVALEQAHP